MKIPLGPLKLSIQPLQRQKNYNAFNCCETNDPWLNGDTILILNSFDRILIIATLLRHRTRNRRVIIRWIRAQASLVKPWANQPTDLALKLMIHFTGTRNTNTHTHSDRRVVCSTIFQTFLNQIFMSFHFPSAVGQEQRMYRVAISTFLTFPLPPHSLLNNLKLLNVTPAFNQIIKSHYDTRMCARRIFLLLIS